MSQRSGRFYRGIGIVAVCILLGGSALAVGQVRIGFGIAVPGLSIGINIPTYPELVPVPGYPVYYAPRLSANLFFYDGLYWVLVGDDWYYSSWYDGPWYLAEPELVPDFILRIPILYYRSPPPYFLHWNRAAPPRWGEHWGSAWESRRHGWDRWNRAVVPPRAPLPSYQRHYPRNRYPGTDRQRTLENRFYKYRPRDPRDRGRLQQAPQSGLRIAPPPNRPSPESRLRIAPQPTPERRPPARPPQAHRPPPVAVPPRPGAERRSPEENRPSPRPGARPTPPPGIHPAPEAREGHRNEKPDEQRRGRPPPGHPPPG